MTELERIQKNTKGELPQEGKTIITVSGIDRAEYKLGLCKAIISSFLKNKSMKHDDPMWNGIMPIPLVRFIRQIDETDMSNDHYLFPIPIYVNDLQTTKPWEWYSSELIQNGFKIILSGHYPPKFTWMIHCLNIPLDRIWIDDDRFGAYGVWTFKDVTSYKTFKDI